VSVLLLIWVDFAGEIGMGAQRWIDIGVVQIQPSEVMKITLVLTLARYFHGLSYEDVGRPLSLIVPTILVLLPAALVLKQPDLGTAGMLMMVAAAMFVVVGVRWWKFALVIALGVAVAYYAWNSTLLHDYQKARVLILADSLWLEAVKPLDDGGYLNLRVHLAVTLAPNQPPQIEVRGGSIGGFELGQITRPIVERIVREAALEAFRRESRIGGAVSFQVREGEVVLRYPPGALDSK